MAYRKHKDYHKIINNINYKKCIDCENWFEMNDTNFGKDKNKKSGFNVRCKTCQKKNNEAYYADHREKQIADAIVWKKNNRDKVIASMKKTNQRLDRIEDIRRRMKEYREAGRDTEWRRNNPDKCKQYSEQHRDHDVSKTEEESMLKVFNYSCAYCGMTLKEHKKKYKEKLHNDHVDDNGYNDLRNDVPACKSCNCGKHTEDMENWFRRQTFFSEEKLSKIIWWITEGYKDYIEDKPPYKITKKQNEDGKTFHWELWTVDEMRNMIECIGKRNKKKELNTLIQEMNEL